QPWPMKILVDSLLGPEPLPEALRLATRILPGADTANGLLTWTVLAGLAIFTANSAVEMTLARGSIRVGQRMVYRLAADLFARLQRRSLLFHSRHPVGDSISRITGDSWCVHTLIETLLIAPASALLAGAMMVMLMAQLNPSFTLLALA